MKRERKQYYEKLYEDRANISAWIPAKLKAKLQTHARRRGEPMGTVLARIIREGLKDAV